MFDAPSRTTRPRKTPLKSFRSLTHLGKLRRRGEIPVERKRQLLTAWFAACGATCGECGVRMVRQKPGDDFQLPHNATIDHIKARGLGGTNSLRNLRIICHSCNNAKSHEENRELERRKKMYRQRAFKAARTRARKKARAIEKVISKAAMKAYHKAKSSGATETEAKTKARERRAELETKQVAA